MVEEPVRTSSGFYVVEVSCEVYDRVRDGLLEKYPVPLTEHLPALPTTFKDLPKNIANTLRDVVVGDTLTFHCEMPTGEYSADIERKVATIRIDSVHQVKYLCLERERPPAWKRK